MEDVVEDDLVVGDVVEDVEDTVASSDPARRCLFALASAGLVSLEASLIVFFLSSRSRFIK